MSKIIPGLAFLAAGVTAILSCPSIALAAGFEILVPHRAIYDLELKDATERSGVQSMNGRIVYEITGNACEGMAVRYRFVTNIATSDQSYQTDQQTTTFETPDGKEFTFLTRTFVDSRPDNEVRGTAIRKDGSLTVELTRPSARTVELPDAIFISTHLSRLIDHAQSGDRFASHMIFDGSEDADEVVTGSAVIGEARTYDEVLPNEAEDAVSSLRKEQAWPVSVSYFEIGAGASTEKLPVYEATFLLYSNGISRNLTMRYDEYALSGQLVGLEILEAGECETPNPGQD